MVFSSRNTTTVTAVTLDFHTNKWTLNLVLSECLYNKIFMESGDPVDLYTVPLMLKVPARTCAYILYAYLTMSAAIPITTPRH
jgi:hypothetical protein